MFFKRKKRNSDKRFQKIHEMKTGRLEAFSNRIWVLLTLGFTWIYLWWRLRYTLPLAYGMVSIVAGVSLFVVELLGALESMVHFFNMDRIENHPTPEVPHHLFPHVDIFIATYSEPEDLLYKTVNGCLHMDYPDKSKVHIYLCDDSRRGHIRALAERMGVGYFDRPDNKGAKAGNLNNAMANTDSPLMVTLDADMIPKHDFLMKVVPHFVDAEIKNQNLPEKDKIKMGFVQTPQSFYNPDLFQFNLFSEGRIPNEQDYFYKDIQVARNKTNSVIYGGSNTMLSRAAINDIGGFYTDAITEDFATGILLQKKGYICIALNEVLASGLSATDLKSLIQQRVRWARGCISTGRKMHILLTPKLSIGQKANYWASVWYWYAPFKRLIYIMSPVMFSVFGFVVIECTLREILIFWLPMYITNNIALKKLSRNIRTIKWTGIYETSLFPFLLMPVLAESFGITLKKFKVTSKDVDLSAQPLNTTHLIPFIILAVLTFIGTLNCVRIIFKHGTLTPMVVLFWQIQNLFNLVMSIFFIMGRRMFRTSERVEAQVDCRIVTHMQRDIICKTKDFSETGISVILEKPTDIDEDEEVELHMTTERYKAKLLCKIVHVSQMQDDWKYAFRIVDTCGTYNDFLQIIYDRVPSLPTNLSSSLSSFDDVKINISRRSYAVSFQNRRYPRIDINENCSTLDGKIAFIKNFNYKFIVLGADIKQKELRLMIAGNLILNCQYERDLYDGSKLYAIQNYDEFHNDPQKSALLGYWLNNVIERNRNKILAARKGKRFALDFHNTHSGEV